MLGLVLSALMYVKASLRHCCVGPFGTAKKVAWQVAGTLKAMGVLMLLEDTLLLGNVEKARDV